MIEFIKEKVELKTADEVLKLHLVLKCHLRGISVSEGDLNSLIELYKIGYGTDFVKNCVAKEYFKSEQTVRNAITRLTQLGVLIAIKRGQRKISKDFLPEINSDKLIVQYLIGNP